MESTIHRIRRLYPEMGPGEKKIADYILNNTSNILECSVTTLAKLSGCGDATVVRFSRRVGYDGFQALKIGIASEMGATSSVSSEIGTDDTCFEIYKKHVEDIRYTLQNTETVLDADMLERAAKSIMNAQRIVIFGLGNSAAIATDAAHKLLRVGLNAQACCDNHLQAIIASHLDRNSVVIGISHSGSSKDVVEALRLSKIGNATTICITNHDSSPIVAASDIALFTKSEETRYSILALSSRIAQLAILDAIYTYIVIHSDKASLQAIYKTEYSLQNKKY